MRRLKRQVEQALRMVEWAGEDPPVRKRSARNPQAMRRAMGLAQARQEGDGDWSDARPAEIVGLYAILHEHVYSVPPAELAEAWMGAVSAASKMLRDDFGGNPAKMVDFLRWAWRRERGREKKRSAGDGAGRIGWRLQFASRNLLTDYRVDQERDRRAQGAAR